jgi:NAD(P)-dependent dehydrogenase (short-subunit alcohol dehydrogenase family)
MGHLEDRAGLAGKCGIVVGGAAGLGRACVDDLAAAGMKLVIADRDADALAAAEARAADQGWDVVTFAADARDAEAMARLFERADDRLGRLDVLVNVVGGTFRQPFADSNPRGWDTLIRTNFTWLLATTHLALPRMRAAGGGSIVNFTSIEAHRAAPNYAVYAGMKAGVLNFTRTLAVELAPERIRVNCIAADMTPTEGMEAQQFDPLDSPARRASYEVVIPMGRHGEYADIGGCALFLASDLSAYVTGTTMHPDGGALASSGWFNWPGEGFANYLPAPVVDRVQHWPEG